MDSQNYGQVRRNSVKQSNTIPALQQQIHFERDVMPLELDYSRVQWRNMFNYQIWQIKKYSVKNVSAKCSLTMHFI